jgi:hypothetical protein
VSYHPVPRSPKPPRFNIVVREADLELIKHGLLTQEEANAVPETEKIHVAVPAVSHQIDSAKYDRVCINVEDAIHEISISSLLEFFWTNLADSSCMVCDGPFDPEVDGPIRTISLALKEPHVHSSALSIRVHNRHLACALQFSVPFVTISHVWDNAVAEAHLQGRLSANNSAAREL